MHQKLMICYQAKNTRRLLVLKKIYLSVALTWTCSIIFLCLISFNNLPNLGIKNTDKYVHFIFHFIFVNLWFLYFNYKNSENRIKFGKILFIVSFLFGILIELAQQTFTINRKADIFDVIANTTGAFFALIIIFMYDFIKRAKSNY